MTMFTFEILWKTDLTEDTRWKKYYVNIYYGHLTSFCVFTTRYLQNTYGN